MTRARGLGALRRWRRASARVSASLFGLLACTPPVSPPGDRARARAPAESPTELSPRARADVPSARTPTRVDGPRIRVLGIAQDGGMPHAACSCERCAAARAHPERRRHVASLGIITPSRTVLVDATPDIREQLVMLADVGARGQGATRGAVDRHPVDGVLLTHAHIGHYLGLAFLGFEAISTKRLRVHASPAMSAFLSANAPWEQLVRIENITLEPIAAGSGIELADGVRVTAVRVPHRDEYADTLAYRLEGARARVLYLPDCDPWARWRDDPLGLFDSVDVALVDGSFFSGDELPGRDLSKIGHPLMTDTMDLLESRVAAGTLEVAFIHLNHSNPALVAGSEARAAIEARGFTVAREGDELPL